MRLDPLVQQFVLDQRLGFVATVRPDGSPNLSPKGTTTVWDDEHLMFADVASPQTVANIRVHPRVEINVVDPIIRKGYRFRGTAEVHDDGPGYARGIEILQSRGSSLGPDTINAIVVIEIEEVRTVVSPAYSTGATEAEIATRWLAHFDALHGDR